MPPAPAAPIKASSNGALAVAPASAIAQSNTSAMFSLWTPEQIALVKSQIAPGSTDLELEYFADQCKRSGLDPFTRQIYAIRRRQYDPAKKTKVEKMTIQVAIDGFRVIAQRSNLYDGQDGPFWCGADGEWKDVWLDRENPPLAAKVITYRKDCARGFVGVALFSEYAATDYDGNATGLWKKSEKPSVMIAKCADSLSLRKAFPHDLSGLYTVEEMAAADKEPRESAAPRDPQSNVLPTSAWVKPAAEPVKALPAPVKAAPKATPASPSPTVADAAAADRKAMAEAERKAEADRQAAADATPAPAPTPAATAPAPAPAAPAAAPAAPAPAEAELSEANAAIESMIEMASQLNSVGEEALMVVYRKLKGFEKVTTMSEWIEVASVAAKAHSQSLTEKNVGFLNQGLHPKTQARLVEVPAAAEVTVLSDDAVDPFSEPGIPA